MNRKERRLALRTALSSRAADMIVVKTLRNSYPTENKGIDGDRPLGVEPERVLLILPERAETVYLSARNVANLKLIPATQLNIYDLLNADKIVTTTSAIEKIQEVYGG